MLDIKFIKENADLIKEAARKKHIKFDVDGLLQIDETRLETLSLVENL
ncbi:MAG: serine--tRNA ligase, partial [Patescibacteria group bacterium]